MPDPVGERGRSSSGTCRNPRAVSAITTGPYIKSSATRQRLESSLRFRARYTQRKRYLYHTHSQLLLSRLSWLLASRCPSLLLFSNTNARTLREKDLEFSRDLATEREARLQVQIPHTKKKKKNKSPHQEKISCVCVRVYIRLRPTLDIPRLLKP